jgi:hypothetical protein
MPLWIICSESKRDSGDKKDGEVNGAYYHLYRIAPDPA